MQGDSDNRSPVSPVLYTIILFSLVSEKTCMRKCPHSIQNTLSYVIHQDLHTTVAPDTLVAKWGLFIACDDFSKKYTQQWSCQTYEVNLMKCLPRSLSVGRNFTWVFLKVSLSCSLMVTLEANGGICLKGHTPFSLSSFLPALSPHPPLLPQALRD